MLDEGEDKKTAKDRETERDSECKQLHSEMDTHTHTHIAEQLRAEAELCDGAENDVQAI